MDLCSSNPCCSRVSCTVPRDLSAYSVSHFSPSSVKNIRLKQISSSSLVYGSLAPLPPRAGCEDEWVNLRMMLRPEPCIPQTPQPRTPLWTPLTAQSWVPRPAPIPSALAAHPHRDDPSVGCPRTRITAVNILSICEDLPPASYFLSGTFPISPCSLFHTPMRWHLTCPRAVSTMQTSVAWCFSTPADVVAGHAWPVQCQWAPQEPVLNSPLSPR